MRVGDLMAKHLHVTEKSESFVKNSKLFYHIMGNKYLDSCQLEFCSTDEPWQTEPVT